MPREIINTTAHPITFESDRGECKEVQPCGFVTRAQIKEREVDKRNGAVLIKTEFVPDPHVETLLEFLEQRHPDSLIVGSVIAAKAYSGRVLGIVPRDGHYKVPPSLRRYHMHKFAIFPENGCVK